MDKHAEDILTLDIMRAVKRLFRQESDSKDLENAIRRALRQAHREGVQSK